MLNDLTPWPPVDRGQTRYFARSFAECREDLDVNFAASRNVLVSRLLAACLRSVHADALSEESVWDWSVAERLQGLLAVARASTGAHLHAVTQCGHEDCAGKVEMELGIEGFAAETAAQLEWTTPTQQKLLLRLPSGRDLAAWHLQLSSGSESDEHWLASLLVIAIDDQPPPKNWQLPREWLPALSMALADADPLTALTLQVPCPFCNRPVDVAVDLEQLLIAGLRSKQARLTEEVHQLAAHYHWSESDIVAMPAWRRRKYLSRLQAELS